MLKKMTLLAGMALAVIAFAVPASASAQVWNGSHEDSLTGFIAFGNPEPEATKFGCFSHAAFDVTGGTSTGELTTFEPTTGTCAGEGTFAGCELKEDTTTIPADTTIHLTGTNTSTLTTPKHIIEEEEVTTEIVIHNVYDNNCPIVRSTLTVRDLNLAGTNSDLTDVTISGLATSHVVHRVFGPLPAQTVLVFGTMGTATDTITVS